MNRRDFIKASACAGVAVAAPFSFPSIARADESTKYEGPLWISINTNGGWDPTMVCDPKGGSVNSNFTTEEIAEIGPFKVAPLDFVTGFFNKHKSKITVMNGIDTETNSHSPGRRNIWSGSLSEGHPTFAALVAASLSPNSPMAFINNGGYDFTADLIAPTRADDSDLDIYKGIANPNFIDPAGAAYYHDEDIAKFIKNARSDRLSSQRLSQHLPRVKHAMSTLYTARLGQKELKKLTKHLGSLDDSGNPLIRQGQLAIAAYKAGLAVSANLVIGGFDTHSNHNNAQGNALERLFTGLNFIMDEAEDKEIADNIIIMVSSDFARTPGYNKNNGKDHWPYTSMMTLGASWLPGTRVVGATDEMQNPMRVIPETLQVTGDDDPGGVRLTPAHIHQALRKVAGIENHNFAQLYPLSTAKQLPIFDD
jgi:uncharacterized protein (DUF1501 family)